MLLGQFIVHTVVPTKTVADELALLSDACSSLVLLETLAALVIVDPSGAFESTLNPMVNTAVEFAANVAIVQLIVPVLLPAVGVVHVNPGPDVCASETNVVLPGTELVSTTLCAASGPLLVTSTL
jgi:hypothetical protein